MTVQRGQTVCRAGPYRFVRHPAYAGSALQALGVPLLLGSLWALIPGIADGMRVDVHEGNGERS